MAQFSLETWLLLALVSAAGIIAVLSTLAQTYQHELRMHDLKGRVLELRTAYARRLAEIAARDVPEVEPEDQQPAPPASHP